MRKPRESFSSYISQSPFQVLVPINLDPSSSSPGGALCAVCYHSTSWVSKNFYLLTLELWASSSQQEPPASPLPPSSLSQPLFSHWEQNTSPGNTGLLSDSVFGRLKTGAIFFSSVYRIREETVLGHDEELKIITWSHSRIYIYSTCKYLVRWYFVHINTVCT